MISFWFFDLKKIKSLPKPAVSSLSHSTHSRILRGFLTTTVTKHEHMEHKMWTVVDLQLLRRGKVSTSSEFNKWHISTANEI